MKTQLIQYDEEKTRTLWRFEDELINHRLTWLGFSQGLLFAAYALIYSRVNWIETEAGSIAAHFVKSDNLPPIPIVLDSIALLGIFLCFIVVVGVIAAIFAMMLIHKRSSSPVPGISSTTTIIGLLPPLFIPAGFSAFWITMLTNTQVEPNADLIAYIFIAFVIVISLILTGLFVASHHQLTSDNAPDLTEPTDQS